MLKSVELFCLLALLPLAVGCSGSGTIWCCSDGDNDLVSFLRDEGYRIHLLEDVQAALDKAPEGAAVLLLNGCYPDSVMMLSGDQLCTIEEKGLKVFAEYACTGSEIPQVHEIEYERVVVTDSLSPELKPMDLLSVNRGYYFRIEDDDPAMVIARVAGFDRAVYGLEGTPYYPLVYKENDNLWLSTSQLSDFARVRFMPEMKWKSFWETVISGLTGKNVVFGSWPWTVHPSYGRDTELPDTARAASVRRGVEWFYNGHFLVDPSWKSGWLDKYQGDGLMPVGPGLPAGAADGDGTSGILEGHCSAIYADGKQAYRYWLRCDVQGEAAMALAAAGELLGEDRYKNVASNLIDYAFRTFRSGPRDDAESPSYGLLSWSVTNKGTYYGDDNARAILGMIMAADILGSSRWDRKITEAILANFRTSGKYGFRGDLILDEDLKKNGWEYYHSRDLVNPHPHFESWMWACYLWLYRQTGYAPLLDLAEKGISDTMEVYPSGWSWTNGLQQERARMILPLAWLYRVSPTEEHLAWLDMMTGELLRNQVECGAIREELGDPGKGMFGKIASNDAYGKAEAPLIFDNGDPVSDMLYTCNFAFFGLNEAACATGDPEIVRAAEKLSDFLTRIQVRSESVKDVDGAWFRAFNFRDWNYWASDADSGWGASSTLTGWIQSWIVVTQALMEEGTSYWDETSGSGTGKYDKDVFDEMLK